MESDDNPTGGRDDAATAADLVTKPCHDSQLEEHPSQISAPEKCCPTRVSRATRICEPTSAPLTLPVSPPDDVRQLDKLKHFLAAVQNFAMDVSPYVSDYVRSLVVALVNAHITEEEFHGRLVEATSFPLKPYVVPFLKSTLPALRSELGRCSHLCSMPASTQPNLPTFSPTGRKQLSSASGLSSCLESWCVLEQPNLKVPTIISSAKQRLRQQLHPYERQKSDATPTSSPPRSISADGLRDPAPPRRGCDVPVMGVACSRRASQSKDLGLEPSPAGCPGWLEWDAVRRCCSPVAGSTAQPSTIPGRNGSKATHQRKHHWPVAGSGTKPQPQPELAVSENELTTVSQARDANLRIPNFMEEWLNIQAMVDCMLLMLERVQESVAMLHERNSGQQRSHASVIAMCGQTCGQRLRGQSVVDNNHVAAGCGTSVTCRDRNPPSGRSRSRSSSSSGGRSSGSTGGHKPDVAVDAIRRDCGSTRDDQNSIAAGLLPRTAALPRGRRAHRTASRPHGQATTDGPSAETGTGAAMLQRKGSCWHCGRRTDKMCSNCCKARYCSLFCQQKDWPGHSVTCLSNTSAKGTEAKTSS